jgi:hypothetical protein
LWSKDKWRKAMGIVLHTKYEKSGRHYWQANSVIDLWISGIRVASCEPKSIKKQNFLKKTDSRSAPPQMSCLLWNSRLIKQQSIFWYRGHFKASQILRTLSPKLSQLAEPLSKTDPHTFYDKKDSYIVKIIITPNVTKSNFSTSFNPGSQDSYGLENPEFIPR